MRSLLLLSTTNIIAEKWIIEGYAYILQWWYPDAGISFLDITDPDGLPSLEKPSLTPENA